MDTELDLPAQALLPQKGDMCLLERVIAAGEDHLVATTVLRGDSLFCRDGRIGAWVGLECMAQAVAAWAGYQGRQRGQPPRMGFLLAASRFDCERPWLQRDRLLRIEVHRQIQLEDGLGQFTTELFDGAQRLASAVMTVFSPEDPSVVIEAARHG